MRIKGVYACWEIEMVAATISKDAAAQERRKATAQARPKAAAIAKADTMRLNLLLPAKSIERLDRLKDKTEAASYTEVIRNAIRLYEAIIAEYEKGNKVQILDSAGRPTSLSIF